MMNLVLAMVELMGIGTIGAGLVILHHLLKKKEAQAMAEAFKTTMIPEIKKMTMDMLKESMEIIPDMTIDMTKKFLKVQKEMEDELY